MLDLNRYFENPFYPLETTEGNFVEGTDRHIALLQGNNPGGVYATILADIKTKRTTLKTILSDRDSEQTEQQGSTITMNKAMAAFQKMVRIREGLIKSTFEGEDSAQYQEFFPHGLSEYSQATLATVETLMDRMVSKATKYVTELGTPLKAECEDKRTAFTNARTAQLTNIGETSNWDTEVQKAIVAVSRQLTLNLLTIAQTSAGTPVTADMYFEQQYFRSPEETGLYMGENAPNQTKTVRSQGWSADKPIEVTNPGINSFVIGFVNAQGVPVSAGQTVAPGQTLNFTAAALGYNVANRYLNVTGIDGTGAKWKVKIS